MGGRCVKNYNSSILQHHGLCNRYFFCRRGFHLEYSVLSSSGRVYFDVYCNLRL